MVMKQFRLIRTVDSQIVPPVQISVRVRKGYKRITWRLAGQQMRCGNAILTDNKKLNWTAAQTLPPHFPPSGRLDTFLVVG